MLYSVFCVLDTKAAAFHPPFISTNRYTAQRQLSDIMSSAEHPYHRHAEDYDLYLVGQWDDATGTMTPALPDVVTKLTALR